MAATLLRCNKRIGQMMPHQPNHLRLHCSTFTPLGKPAGKASISTSSCKKNSDDHDSASSASSPWQRSSYKYFLPIQTRWSDNDQYGHVNNVVYYSYFDSVINHYLIRRCGLNTDVRTSSLIGYIVDTRCTYREPISFPQVALAGLAISHIGRSSVRYSVAIFAEDKPDQGKPADCSATHKDTACAIGQCTHVFVDTTTNRPMKLPDAMREALQKIHLGDSEPSSKL